MSVLFHQLYWCCPTYAYRCYRIYLTCVKSLALQYLIVIHVTGQVCFTPAAHFL